MKFIRFGSNGILIQLKQVIDPEINRKISWLNAKVECLPEVIYSIPAYCSITVVFDPVKTDFERLKKVISNWDLDDLAISTETRKFKIPVCYESEFAPDMEEVSQLTNLTSTEIISLHSSQHFLVYMMGFIPGFPYMGKLPDQLYCKRKDTPRKQVAAGSVGLAGSQTGIYPAKAPGGWQLIGTTPLPIFKGEDNDPFFFKMGDKVRFYAISKEEFDHISNEHVTGRLTKEEYYD